LYWQLTGYLYLEFPSTYKINIRCLIIIFPVSKCEGSCCEDSCDAFLNRKLINNQSRFFIKCHLFWKINLDVDVNGSLINVFNIIKQNSSLVYWMDRWVFVVSLLRQQCLVSVGERDQNTDW
jgi:hypothetical protein